MKIKIWCRGTSKNLNFDTPRWIEPHEYIFAKYNSTSLLLYLSGKREDIQEFLDEFAVVRSTELFDRNGKEIYEGDILKSYANEKPCNYIVKWGETKGDYCGFILNPVFIDPPRFTYIVHNFKMWMADGFEVIGNIFETPELLKP